jgi:hypothetical protein
MRALSLWQPWASYITVGMKRFETRHWSTSYRGPLAIHAAKRRLTVAEQELLAEYPLTYSAGVMPLGAQIATCRLLDVIPVTYALADQRERDLGNFEPGRFAWVLLDVVPLARPVPLRGRQGLFEIPDSILEAESTRRFA